MMKTETLNAGSLTRLVRPVARALAHAYACGWKQHAQLVGEMQGTTPDQWADANAEMFIQEATDALWPNVEITDGYRRPTAPNPPKSERR